jgi:CRP/FNR family transcriptional regulator, cyclic AMP receptor protein
VNESDGQDAPPGAAAPPEPAQPFPRAADKPGQTLRGGLHVELDAEPANPAAPVTGVSIPADQALQLLARINLFSGLQPSYLRHIANLGLEENYDPGALIFAEGAQGDKVYLILSGAVRISRQVPGMGEEALAVLRAGTYFGEMALIDDFPRSADARAHEACRLFVIRKEDLEDLLFVDRDLAYDLLWSFVRTLSSRLRETNDKMTFMAVTSKF